MRIESTARSFILKKSERSDSTLRHSAVRFSLALIRESVDTMQYYYAVGTAIPSRGTGWRDDVMLLLRKPDFFDFVFAIVHTDDGHTFHGNAAGS